MSRSTVDPQLPRVPRILAEAPQGCGVYILLDEVGKHLYVGKSIAIRRRLQDHQKGADQGVEKEALIMGRLASARFIETAGELEALILENTLIKRHRPRFNVVLRDDKTYPYLRIDPREPFGRLAVVRRVRRDGARYFGPYVTVKAMRGMLRWIGTIFPLRACEEDAVPSRARPCLNAEIGRCLGPCAGKVDEAAYREVAEDVILFLGGRHDRLHRRFEKRMAEASSSLRGAEAARMRDRLRELEAVFERQSVYGGAFPSADAVGLARGSEGWTAFVMQVRQGSVVGGEPRHLLADPSIGEEELLESFIERHYAEAADLPRTVLVPVMPSGRELLEAFLTSRAGHRVELHAPGRGRGIELLLLARRNALALQRTRGRRAPLLPEPATWKPLTGNGPPPSRIEVYDASSLKGQEAVVGMVLWEDGALSPGGYRRFRIKRAPLADDYAMISEAVGRRAARIRKGEEPAPDLLLVDGGAGHVGAVAAALHRGGLAGVPVAGIAKGERRRDGDRLVAGDGTVLPLPPDDPLVRFLGGLRDEVHRWAVGYHRQRRSMALTRSTLDDIPGVGPRRRAILLSHFGDARTVSSATLEDLLAVPGLPADAARQVHRHFHGK